MSVHMTGRSASREAAKVLAPLLDHVLATARAESLGIALHFEELEYFNSSTIAALVQFIRAASGAGIALDVVYDSGQKWQAMSFDALRRALKPFEGPEGPAIRFSRAAGPQR
jgi:hypothetical protein